MPILVKDFTWSQTNNVVHIRVPLNPVAHEKVDLFPTEKYIKANFSPFLFELFPLYDVNIKKSKCFVKEDVIILDLMKYEEITWECLEKELTKDEKMKIRQEVLDKCLEQAKQDSEDKQIRKSQLDRYTVQQAMEIDSQQHKLMDSRRDFERKKAMDELEEWRLGKVSVSEETNETKQAQGDGKIKALLPTKDEEQVKAEMKKDDIEVQEKEGQGDGKIKALPQKKGEEQVEVDTKKDKNEVQEKEDKPINKEPQSKPVPRAQKPPKPVKTPVKSEYVEQKKQETAKRVLPRLRQTMNLEIKHTPRTFPTPSRESTAEEEQAWLKNITLARRATGFVSEDLRPEEQDPQWCKEKGDEFFKNGNFLGAISAYTHGITLSDKLPSLYANRSATHFALGNFNKCLNDCSTALDLMKPACESNRRSRAKCIARRAAALARLGYLSKAIDEMKAAGKLLPDDETIKKDIYDMERAWEQSPDSD